MLCGKPIKIGNEIYATIGETNYVFDKDDCVLICKKLKSVYGSEFCVNLTV
jgi:hypothetical protein